jgi:hypothetical protein
VVVAGVQVLVVAGVQADLFTNHNNSLVLAVIVLYAVMEVEVNLAITH